MWTFPNNNNKKRTSSTCLPNMCYACVCISVACFFAHQGVVLESPQHHIWLCVPKQFEGSRVRRTLCRNVGILIKYSYLLNVIKSSSRSRHIWIIWRNETVRQMAHTHTHRFNYHSSCIQREIINSTQVRWQKSQINRTLGLHVICMSLKIG